MTWFKVDDKLHSHKKAARAGIAAMGLWSVAGSWCADQLTDGFVPDYIAHRLAPGEADELASRLVKAGLWVVDTEDGDEGWRFHGWDEYQPTRDDVESQRERDREKKRNQRRSKGGQFQASPRDEDGVSPRDTDGYTPRDSDGSHTVPTRPDPSRPEPEKKRAKKRSPETPLPELWTPNQAHMDLARELGVHWRQEADQFRDHAQANDRRQRDWDAAFRTWLRNAKKWSKPDVAAVPANGLHL